MRKSITRRQIHSLRARLRANGDTTALGELELLLALDKSGRRASGSLLSARSAKYSRKRITVRLPRR